MTDPLKLFLIALSTLVLAWVVAQIFDRKPSGTFLQHLFAKLLPLSLVFLGVTLLFISGLLVSGIL